jgi:hypothetical protein
VSLNATAVEIHPEAGHTLELPAVSSNPPPTSQVLRIELVSLDRMHYRQWDRVKYDVQITNVIGESVTIPWSPVPIARRDRPAAGYRHAVFALVLMRNAHPDWAVDTFVLYGAPAVPGSLRTIRPNETVTIRLSAVLSGNGDQGPRNPIVHARPELRAGVEMVVYAPDDPRFHHFRAEHSTRGQPITIVPPTDTLLTPGSG